jgi:plastocyanin
MHVGKFSVGLAAVVLVLAVAAGSALAAPTTTVLRVKAVDGIKFDKTSLRATAGKVTIVMKNRSPLSHNIAIKGHGVNVKGKIVPKGGTSTVTVTLKKGRYAFYCSVDAHEQAGMKGTLAIT